MNHYFLIYKPYLVLAQFSPEAGKQTLKDFFDVPRDVYPVGRLDYDSEGLMILTNDKQLNHRLLHPAHAHEREYWVQVDGAIDDQALAALANGVTIQVDGKPHQTKAARVKLMEQEPDLPQRVPPIRYRKSIPAPWISLVIAEGKNRQVRKMTARVGYPTLRLVRYRIEGITVDGMRPGDLQIMDKTILYQQLFHGKAF